MTCADPKEISHLEFLTPEEREELNRQWARRPHLMPLYLPVNKEAPREQTVAQDPKASNAA